MPIGLLLEYIKSVSICFAAIPICCVTCESDFMRRATAVPNRTESNLLYSNEKQYNVFGLARLWHGISNLTYEICSLMILLFSKYMPKLWIPFSYQSPKGPAVK